MKPLYLERSRFTQLIDTINHQGFRLIGPQVKDNAIIFDTIQQVSQFPVGVIDHQQPGHYELEKTNSPRWFAWSSGPQALKPLFFKPREYLWQVSRDSHGKLQFTSNTPALEPIAIIGAKACDLTALSLQDQHFIDAGEKDPYYAAARKKNLIIAVNCFRSADTCFCASTGDGPEVSGGYDLLLSELDEGFIVTTGSDSGGSIVQGLHLPIASQVQINQTLQEIDNAAQAQKRSLPPLGNTELDARLLDHSTWDDIAKRCLSCGNCTSVCPSCFCHDVGEEPDINGQEVQHYRQWSSCFTDHHSYMHGSLIRDDTALRYRQWFTHKLITWHQQYGRSGCVGCGRCITWCPVGIDITHETQTLGMGDA